MRIIPRSFLKKMAQLVAFLDVASNVSPSRLPLLWSNTLNEGHSKTMTFCSSRKVLLLKCPHNVDQILKVCRRGTVSRSRQSLTPLLVLPGQVLRHLLTQKASHDATSPRKSIHTSCSLQLLWPSPSHHGRKVSHQKFVQSYLLPPG